MYRKSIILEEKSKKKIKKSKDSYLIKAPRPLRPQPSGLHQHSNLPPHASKQPSKAYPQPTCTPTYPNLSTQPHIKCTHGTIDTLIPHDIYTI